MPQKCRVLLFIGCRSDEGLSAPILKRLENDSFFYSHVQPLYAGDFKKTYELIDYVFDNDTDLVICVGDRLEMFAAATASFVNNIPIAHIYAGVIVSGHPTKDEVFRHSISLMSDIQFVQSKKAMLNLEMLFRAVKKESNCHIVGLTHLEDLEVDESLVPKTRGGDIAWYNLILYNPITNPKDEFKMVFEMEKIKKLSYLGKNRNIIIGPNPDKWRTVNYILYDRYKNTTFYKNLPRPQFLGLLKNCQKFITNSSTGVYEAPHFLTKDQIILIGIRNENRTEPDFDITGASNTIIKKIKEWWIKKNEV